MTLHDNLADLGLSNSEITVYLYLLEMGISAPPDISRATGIARSNLHVVLKKLQEKGLARRQLQRKRYAYLPVEPTAALKLFDRKRDALEESMNELQARYKSQKNKPVIKFYEGPDELIEIFEELLNCENKEVLGFASTAQLFALIPNYFDTRFNQELNKRGITLRDVITDESARTVADMSQRLSKWNYEFRVLDKKHDNLPADILIWDDKVAVMTFKAPVFGTITQSQQLADLHRIQFEFMWKSLK